MLASNYVDDKGMLNNNSQLQLVINQNILLYNASPSSCSLLKMAKYNNFKLGVIHP